MRAVTKLTQINLSYRGLHSDVPPVCCEVSRALTRRGLATLARLRTEAKATPLVCRIIKTAISQGWQFLEFDNSPSSLESKEQSVAPAC